MADKKQVITRSSLPAAPPVLLTAVAVIGLKVFSAQEWVWGMVLTLLAGLWIFWIWKLSNEKPTKPLWDSPPPPTLPKK